MAANIKNKTWGGGEKFYIVLKAIYLLNMT